MYALLIPVTKGLYISSPAPDYLDLTCCCCVHSTDYSAGPDEVELEPLRIIVVRTKVKQTGRVTWTVIDRTE